MVKVKKRLVNQSLCQRELLLALLILIGAGVVLFHSMSSTIKVKLPDSSTTTIESATSKSNNKNNNNSGKRVIIVGAGAAGLTAAKRLSLPEHSIQIQILEASNRIGGRVQKMDDFADYPMDVGASLIHDPKWFQAIAQSDEDIDIPTAYLEPQYEGKHGKALLVNTTWYDFFNDHVAPKDPNQVIFNCAVDKIDYTSAETPIQVSCGDRSFSADAVIVTTPLSILKNGDIAFDPPMTKLDEYPGEMWAGIKIVFEFATKFYPPYLDLEYQFKDMFSSEDDDYDEFPGEVEFWDYSIVHGHSKRHVLAGQFIGNPALEYIDLDDSDMAKAILLRLDRNFGQYLATRNYIQHRIVNWSKEPYIQGSFSSHDSRKWRGAQKITERLYLAGEAFPGDKQEVGWVHSAALSGKDAASQLLDYWDQQQQQEEESK